MPVEEIEKVVEALCALDTQTLKRVADRVGIDERTLWRYRKGQTRPTLARARLIGETLAVSSDARSSSDGSDA